MFVHIADVAAGGSLTDIIFNVTAEEDCPPEDGVCSGHPALKDLEVRKALAHATDKQQLLTVATAGTGSPGLSLVPPGLGDFYASEIEDYAFDIDEANAILDAAGYEDTDGDGVRECLPDQDCDDLTFRFNYPADATTGARESEVIQETWQQIGVAITVQVLDADALTSVCCPAFDFDVIMWGWGSDPDPAFLLGVALCAEIPSGFSESGYCNPEYDELYDAAGRRARSGCPRGPHPPDAADPDGRSPVHHPVLLPDDRGVADGHVHRLDRGRSDPRARGSVEPHGAPTDRVGRCGPGVVSALGPGRAERVAR